MLMNELQTQIEELKKQFDKELLATSDLDELYLKYFSKKQGVITQLLKEIPKMGVEEKKILGPALNTIKKDFEDQIANAKNQISKDKYNDPMIDMSFPLKEAHIGKLHPTTQVIREMNAFFRYYGFSIIDGPEIETEEFNFRKLNLPEGHPATDLQDTLYISEKEGILLRTHTSSIESRILTNQKPPIRAVVGNRCYRNETLSATNGAYFWQYQGVVVDKGITIQNLKSTLELFHKFLFGDDVVLRFRYKYYPEVSPGMGVDMQCKFCQGKGCDVCKHRGWIEVLGAGMIHYNTLKMCGIDPEIYTGYAFGMGLDRLVMQKFGINDIRKLYGGGLVYS
jgi:phenylalanyl-tRNA synthetase alpha chain